MNDFVGYLINTQKISKRQASSNVRIVQGGIATVSTIPAFAFSKS